MKLKLLLIQDSIEWGNLLNSFEGSLLQTDEWGTFNAQGLGKEVKKIAFYHENQLVALALCIIEIGRFGNFAYIPRGPLLEWSNIDLVREVFSMLIQFFSSQKVIFIRFDPKLLASESVSRTMKSISAKKSVYSTQVSNAWVLDLKGKDCEELITNARLQGMHKKLPGEIRRAGEKGLSYWRSYSSQDIEIFYRLLRDTADKNGFKIRPKEYYLKELEYLGKSDMIRLYISEFEKEPLSVALIGKYRNEASYLHAASSNSHAAAGAQGFLLWKIIEELHSGGVTRFNFWGVVDSKDLKNPRHPGFGYSKFKMRFGGHLEEYTGSWDIVMNSFKYRLTRGQELYRKWRNGLK